MSKAVDIINKWLGDNKRSKSWLAEELGVTRASVCTWLSDGRIPNTEVRKKLKKMFDVEDDWV